MSKFDRDLSLAELLNGVSPDKLDGALAGLLGADFRLVDSGGQVLLGAATPLENGRRQVLVLDIEPLGFLEGNAPADRLQGTATLLELVLRATLRYRMASTLHVEAVSADYEALQLKHAALQESEARYKALAAELEERVRVQVQTIETAQRQLYQAEKLVSVGQLAAGVAHEINNPIGFIRSNLKTARNYVARFKVLAALLPEGDMASLMAAWREGDLEFVLDDFAQLLDESVTGADRVARIVADLKGFSNVDNSDEAMVDLNDNLRATVNMFSPNLPAGITLEFDLQPIPRLLCLTGHLNQVFLNLLRNASQAIGEVGTIRVSSDVVEHAIRIRVHDDGCGISPEVLPRIFDPFFTTRDVGVGVGLGLTVCRDIVQAHGGRIEVENHAGAGTTFSVFLPLP